MSDFNKNKLANQSFNRTSGRHHDQMQTLETWVANSTPHWKAYGNCTERGTIDAGVLSDGTLYASFDMSETMLASDNIDLKRDVEKRTMTTIYGPAVIELFEMLREVVEPVQPAAEASQA